MQSTHGTALLQHGAMCDARPSGRPRQLKLVAYSTSGKRNTIDAVLSTDETLRRVPHVVRVDNLSCHMCD